MIGSELPKLKTAFYESHFPHCAMAENRRFMKLFNPEGKPLNVPELACDVELM